MHKESSALHRAAEYGERYRQKPAPLHPTATVEELRQLFCIPLPQDGLPGDQVINDLIAAAEPGLVGNTDPNFYAWVMGGSDPTGVAADWLTSIWGQNAGIFQTSPAAAVAEEAVERWLLELLDLPRESSIGFVTGATMAAFVGLSAARTQVLSRAGYDFETHGLQGAPKMHVFFSEELHITNITALRHLGLGDNNFHALPSDASGLLDPETLAEAMQGIDGPKIIIAQAGHINSGGFEDFAAFAEIAKQHDAWLHVDGAFGLWAQATDETRHLTQGIEQADSWSVDGHKWLQIPYDSGFAIVRHPDAHRKAMEISASYLNVSPGDGRNPSSYCPGLSRRARGFAAWAVLRGLGKTGVTNLVRRHCQAAQTLASRISDIDGLTVLNTVQLNQIVLSTTEEQSDKTLIPALANRLNDDHGTFVRTAEWHGRTVLRISIISRETGPSHVERLADAMQQAWAAVQIG